MAAVTQLIWEGGSLCGESSSLLCCGVDEAGRGCLAGPVVAAAVILPGEYALPYLGDSKRLSRLRREKLEPLIKRQALAWSLGLAWPAEIDEFNILQATFRSMTRALRGLKIKPEFAAVDGDKIIPERLFPARLKGLRQKAVVGGDASLPQISAASILAKTFRDRLMRALDRRYPGYGLAGHKGYGTKEHYACLRELGPSRMHRLTFAGVKPSEQLCLPGI